MVALMLTELEHGKDLNKYCCFRYDEREYKNVTAVFALSSFAFTNLRTQDNQTFLLSFCRGSANYSKNAFIYGHLFFT